MFKELEGKESIQVIIRVRPLGDKERLDDSKTCIKSESGDQRLLLVNGNDNKSFAFDQIIGQQQGQKDVFERVGRASTIRCIEGYNCSIFAYGQTGAGKTFTMMGLGQDDPGAFQKRGLIPRTLEYLFESVSKQILEQKSQYLIKCTFLEIYNETIIDLLDKGNKNLQLREDLKKGVYVDGIREETVTKTEEALQLLRRGSKGRHVGSTNYNDASSRSHSVFTVVLQSRLVKNSITNVKQRSFHFIDLAGSEKTKLSNGSRLKEGCSINKSLHVLGMVINSLVESTEGKPRHVGYRDSKLTFLLKDSLGGNSKTHLIANISPSIISYSETLSTLSFAKRVKQIKVNKALINEDATTGSLESMKLEIVRLRQEIIEMRSGAASHMTSVDDQSQLQQFMFKNQNQMELQKLFKQYLEDSMQKESIMQQEVARKEARLNQLEGMVRVHSLNQNFIMSDIIQWYQDRTNRMVQALSESSDQHALDYYFSQGEILAKEKSQLRDFVESSSLVIISPPQSLSTQLSSRVDYLGQLKRILSVNIEQRQQLSSIFENQPEEQSPRKRRLQMEHLEKQTVLREKIQQLSLELELLKQSNQEGEVTIRELVQRQSDYELRMAALACQHSSTLARQRQCLTLKIQQLNTQEGQMEAMVNKLTLELIQQGDLLSKKEEECLDIKVLSAHALQQLALTSEKLYKLQLADSEQRVKVSQLRAFLNEKEQEVYQMRRELEQAVGIVNNVEIQFEEQKSNNDYSHKDILRRHEEVVWGFEKKMADLRAENSSLQAEKTIQSKRNQEFYEQMMQRETVIVQLRVDMDGLNQRLELQRHANQKKLGHSRSSTIESTHKLQLQLLQQNNHLITISHQVEKYKLQITSLCNQLSNRVSVELVLNDKLDTERTRRQSNEEETVLCREKISQLEDNQLKYLRQIDRYSRKEGVLAEQLNSLVREKQSLQEKTKQSRMVQQSLEQQMSQLEQKLARREGQLSRSKDSHSKQVQALKEEFQEYRRRSQQHQLHIKQVFEQCISNKERMLSELKRHCSSSELLLLEQRSRASDQNAQLRELGLKAKELQQELSRSQQELQQRSDTIEELTQELMSREQMNDIKMEERETNFNEFIERKNEDIEMLENELTKVLGMLKIRQQSGCQKFLSLEQEYYITKHNHEELLASYEAQYNQKCSLLDKMNSLSLQLEDQVKEAQDLMREKELISYDLNEKIAEIDQMNLKWQLTRSRDILAIETQFEDYRLEAQKQSQSLLKNHQLLKEQQLKYGELVERYDEVSGFNQQLLEENTVLRQCQARQIQQSQKPYHQSNKGQFDSQNLYGDSQQGQLESISETVIQQKSDTSSDSRHQHYQDQDCLAKQYQTLHHTFEQLEAEYVSSTQEWQHDKMSYQATIQSLSVELEQYQTEEKARARLKGRRTAPQQSEVTLKIDLDRKGLEMKEWYDGISEICYVLNLRGMPEGNNRYKIQTIKGTIEALMSQVTSYKKEIRLKEKELQVKSVKTQIVHRQYNHLKTRILENKNFRDGLNKPGGRGKGTGPGHNSLLQQLHQKMSMFPGSQQNTNLANRY